VVTAACEPGSFFSGTNAVPTVEATDMRRTSMKSWASCAAPDVPRLIRVMLAGRGETVR